MKKLILLIVIISAAGFAKAQSLSSANVTTTVSGTIADSTIQATMDIINNSANSLDILLQRYDVSIVPGSENSFCWGLLCYGPETTLSPLAATIAPGATESSFRGDYSPHGYAGVSTVAYTLFDMNNPNDSIQVSINYNVVTTGIDALEPNSNVISDLSPNPANTLTSFSYSIKDKNRSKVTVTDMLGKTIKSLPLSSNMGIFVLPTSELRSGIYFVSLTVNNGNVYTKKLVVTHK